MNSTAEYVAGMQVQMEKWDADIDALVAEGKKASGEVRTAYDRRLKQLRLSRKAAQKSLEVLRVATGSAAAELQAGMQETWKTMQTALAKVSSDLRA